MEKKKIKLKFENYSNLDLLPLCIRMKIFSLALHNELLERQENFTKYVCILHMMKKDDGIFGYLKSEYGLGAVEICRISDC